MNKIRLKQKDLKPYKLQLLEEQGWTCAICGVRLKKDIKDNPKNIHMDHCHSTGVIRGVLCRTCNTLEGKAWNSYCRQTKVKLRSKEGFLKIIRGLQFYYDNHTKTDILHPTHRTPEEKKELAKKRRARKKKK